MGTSIFQQQAGHAIQTSFHECSTVQHGKDYSRIPKSDLSQSYYKGQISCMKYSPKLMSREVQPFIIQKRMLKASLCSAGTGKTQYFSLGQLCENRNESKSYVIRCYGVLALWPGLSIYVGVCSCVNVDRNAMQRKPQ